MLTINYAYFCFQQAEAGADPVRLPFLRFGRHRQARNLRRASEIPMQTMSAQLRIPLQLDGLPFEAEALQDQVQGQGLHPQAQPEIHSGPVPCEQEHGPALEKEVPAGGLRKISGYEAFRTRRDRREVRQCFEVQVQKNRNGKEVQRPVRQQGRPGHRMRQP